MKREVNWCLVERVCQTDRRGRDETVCERPRNRREKKTEVDGYPEWGREGAEAHGRRDK